LATSPAIALSASFGSPSLLLISAAASFVAALFWAVIRKINQRAPNLSLGGGNLSFSSLVTSDFSIILCNHFRLLSTS
jgi:hypothetical protein